jgi:hypothetical protein
MSRGQTADEKVQLTLRASLTNVSAFNRRERVRASLQDGGGLGMLLSLLAASPVAAASDQRNFHLMGSGGTRTDAQSVSLARRLALELSLQTVDNDAKPTDWSSTITSDIVSLVQKNGGHIVFFDVPLSTPFKHAFNTPARRRDLQGFRNQVFSWNAQFLAPTVQYTDDDLPDLWHAGHDLAQRYSEALANAWTQDEPANLGPGSAPATCTQ